MCYNMTEEIVMIDKNIRKNYDILLAPFITAVVLLVCFAIGKIYPFGSNNIMIWHRGLYLIFIMFGMHYTQRIYLFGLIGIPV